MLVGEDPFKHLPFIGIPVAGKQFCARISIEVRDLRKQTQQACRFNNFHHDCVG